MTSFIRFSIAFILFFYCNNSVAQRLFYDTKIPVKKLRVVPEQAKGGLLADMVTDLEYIPLKTNSKSDAIDYIMDVQVSDDRVGIISGELGQFFLYDLKGNLLKKIDKIKGFKSPDVNNKRGFTRIVKGDSYYELWNGMFKATVDMTGNIIDTLTISKEDAKDDGFGQSVINQFEIGKNGKFKFYGSFQNAKRKKQDILSFNDSVIVRYNPLDTIQMFLMGDDLSKIYNGKAYMSVMYSTKIFELDSTGISTIYDVVLPLKNTFDIQSNNVFKKDDFSQLNRIFEQLRDKALGFSNLISYKDYILFRVHRLSNPMFLAYNIKTNEVIGVSNIISDKSNDFMPFINYERIFVEGDYLYSFIYPSQVSAAKNKSADERHTMRKEYLDLEKFNNPVLVRFKLK